MLPSLNPKTSLEQFAVVTTFYLSFDGVALSLAKLVQFNVVNRYIIHVGPCM